MKRFAALAIVMALLVAPAGVLAQGSKKGSPPASPGQSQYAPGQNTGPGTAKDYAPGQLQGGEPGTAKDFAPGHQDTGTTTTTKKK